MVIIIKTVNYFKIVMNSDGTELLHLKLCNLTLKIFVLCWWITSQVQDAIFLSY